MAVFFLVAGVVMLFPNTNWEDTTSKYGFVSVVLGTLGSIISIFIPSVFVFDFGKETWYKENEDYIIRIPSRKHGMGKSPQIQTFELQPDGYKEVGLGQGFDENGNITNWIKL